MTDWVTPDTGNLLPGDPLTSAKVLFLAQNPIALAEGATGAPKIADKIIGGRSTTTFSGIGAFSGVIIFAVLKGQGGGGPAFDSLSIATSTNGSTFGTLTPLATVASGESNSATIFLDFTSGSWQAIYDSGGAGISGAAYETGTITGTIGTTHIRLAGTNVSYIVKPQGGQSSS